MLQYIEQQIRQSEAKPGTLIHIGAGTGSELQEYLDLNFSRIVLYEAIPELAEELREKSRDYLQVSVEQVVVDGKQGKVNFQRANNPRFSSLTEQKVLKDYYPNLRAESLHVDAVSLTDSIIKLELSDQEINVLVLEVLGKETALLNSVEPDLLHNFNWVIIRTVDYGLPDNRSSDSSNALENGEFISILSYQDIYPFTIKIFKRDGSAISLKAKLKVEIEQKDLELGEAKHKFDSEKQKLESELLVKENRLNEIEEQLKNKASENQKLMEELDKLRKENQELVYRQTALDEEVVKAEAQLELIKDVVIRDKAF